MEEIKTDDYRIAFNPETDTVDWSGTLRLREVDYRPIADLLGRAADSKAAEITVDLRELSFLNSGGINVLSRFLLQVRNNQSSALTVRANQAHAWQRKSLRNVQRLMRGVKMDLVWN
jgi:hypothetical protein